MAVPQLPWVLLLLTLVPGWISPVWPLKPYTLPGCTMLDKSNVTGGVSLARCRQSSQPMVTWPGSEEFWLEFVVLPGLITSVGCVNEAGPKLPSRLTVVTPLKAKDDSFGDVGLGIGVPTIISARFGLKPTAAYGLGLAGSTSMLAQAM